MTTNYSKFLSFSDSQVTPSLQQLCDSGKESNMTKNFRDLSPRPPPSPSATPSPPPCPSLPCPPSHPPHCQMTPQFIEATLCGGGCHNSRQSCVPTRSKVGDNYNDNGDDAVLCTHSL